VKTSKVLKNKIASTKLILRRPVTTKLNVSFVTKQNETRLLIDGYVTNVPKPLIGGHTDQSLLAVAVDWHVLEGICLTVGGQFLAPSKAGVEGLEEGVGVQAVGGED